MKSDPESRGREIKRVKILLIALVALAAATSITLVSSQIIKFREMPFKYDEALQSYPAIFILWDITHCDIAGFAADSLSQKFYPFFPSWLLAPFLGLLGIKIAVARFFSLGCYFFALCFFYLCCRKLSGREGPERWAFCLLPLLSGSVLVLSGLAMRELPGMALSLLLTYLYFQALDADRPVYFAAAGFTATAIFFTKYHYGVHMLMALAISFCQYIWSRRRESLKSLCGRSAALWLPPLAILGIWAALPQNLIRFLHYSFCQPHLVDLLSVQNLLFYPKVFILDFHPGYIIGAVVLILGGAALKRLFDAKIFFLLGYVLVGVFILTVKQQNEVRYLTTTIPAFWLLAAAGWEVLKGRVLSGPGTLRILLGGALVLDLAVGGVFTYCRVPTRYLQQMEYSSELPRIYKFISDVLPETQARYIQIGSSDVLNVPNSRWYLAQDAYKKGSKPVPVSIEEVVDLSEDISGLQGEYLILGELFPARRVTPFLDLTYMEIKNEWSMQAVKTFNLKNYPSGTGKGVLKVSIWKSRK